MIDVNKIFMDNSVEEVEEVFDTGHVQTFVKEVSKEVVASISSEDLLDIPLTIYIVTICSKCSNFHLAGSKIEMQLDNGETEYLVAMPEPEIFAEYCASVAKSIVVADHAPVVAAVVVPCYFSEGNIPPDYFDNDGTFEIGGDDDEAEQEMLNFASQSAKEKIKKFTDSGEGHGDTGEGVVVHGMSLTGSRSSDLVMIDRDNAGFMRNGGKMDIDGFLFGDADVVHHGIASFFMGAADAIICQMAGNDVDLPSNIRVEGLGDDETLL